MPSLIAHLSKCEQQQLFDDLNYLNLREFRSFCKEHSIPYTIYAETKSGHKIRTKDTDRKSIVLSRIRHYLKTGKIPKATCFPAQVVCFDSPPVNLKPDHRLYFGWYNKKNRVLMDLLKCLTDGEFRDGAIARILAREFWTNGKAPTFSEFADAWLEANKQGLGPHPEAAWLTDRARNETGENWKVKRKLKARKVLAVLNSIKLIEGP